MNRKSSNTNIYCFLNSSFDSFDDWKFGRVDQVLQRVNLKMKRVKNLKFEWRQPYYEWNKAWSNRDSNQYMIEIKYRTWRN